MTTNKNIREQRPAKTDVEKLFVIAVNELMQIWDNNSEHNVEKMNSIVRSLRAKKLFSKRVYDKLESFFRPDGRFFAINGDKLLFNKGRKVLRLLPVLDAQSEHKILQETCLDLYYYSDALQKLVENPHVTLDDLESVFICGDCVELNDNIIDTLKRLWNQEVAKTNGCPGQEARMRYGVCIACIKAMATSKLQRHAEKKLFCANALKKLPDIDDFMKTRNLQNQMLVNAQTKVK